MKRNILRIILASVIVLTLILGTANSTFAGSRPGEGSQRFDLLNPLNDTDYHGFVIFNVDQLADTIRVTVSARNLSPNVAANVTHYPYIVKLWVNDEIVDTQHMATSGKGSGGVSFVYAPDTGAGTYEVGVQVTMYIGVVASTPGCPNTTTVTINQ